MARTVFICRKPFSSPSQIFKANGCEGNISLVRWRTNGLETGFISKWNGTWRILGGADYEKECRNAVGDCDFSRRLWK